MTEYPNITPRETTGSEAASAASRILRDSNGTALEDCIKTAIDKLMIAESWLRDVETLFRYYREDAKTAAASALTQKEPKP